MRDGDLNDGNAGCDPTAPLKALTMYKVKIQLRDTQVAVYVNNKQVCMSAREDRAAYKNVLVYASDPCVRLNFERYYACLCSHLWQHERREVVRAAQYSVLGKLACPWL